MGGSLIYSDIVNLLRHFANWWWYNKNEIKFLGMFPLEGTLIDSEPAFCVLDHVKTSFWTDF